MPRTEGGGHDWVHPLFSENLPAAYLNPRAVTRNLADKVSKGHTMGLAGREKHCLRHFLSHLDHWEWPAEGLKDFKGEIKNHSMTTKRGDNGVTMNWQRKGTASIVSSKGFVRWGKKTALCWMPGQPSLKVYDAQLHLLPDAVSEITQQRIYKLQEILRYHNILDCGTKAHWLQKWQCSEGGGNIWLSTKN